MSILRIWADRSAGGLGWVIERFSYAAMYRSAAAILLAGTVSFLIWDRDR